MGQGLQCICDDTSDTRRRQNNSYNSTGNNEEQSQSSNQPAISASKKVLRPGQEISEESETFFRGKINYQNLYKLELNKHNKFRRKHHVPDLTLNPELSMLAQKHADKLALTNTLQNSNEQDRELKNHPGEWVGENLFYCWASSQAAYVSGSATQSWYDEINDYNFQNNVGRRGKVTGHFTQVVWKNTREVGFGIAFNENNCYFVANYYPGGNINNDYQNNVLQA